MRHFQAATVSSPLLVPDPRKGKISIGYDSLSGDSPQRIAYLPVRGRSPAGRLVVEVSANSCRWHGPHGMSESGTQDATQFRVCKGRKRIHSNETMAERKIVRNT